MQRRSPLATYGVLTLLLLFTSCIAPDQVRVARASAPVTDARELVRRLAPGVSALALAALPDAARSAPVAVPAAALPFTEVAATVGDAVRARECLTAAVYYEARSESEDGQRAVAQVVLNRVRDRAFPHSVCGVVYQGVGRGKGCQFSFACDGSMLRPREPGAWARAEAIATAALNGEVMAAVGNATFYHASYVLPWWASSLTRLGAVGSHIFYRWPGAVEHALGMRARYAGVEPSSTPSPTPVVEDTVIADRSADAEVDVVRGTGWTVTVHRASAPAASATTVLDPAPARRAHPVSVETIAGVRIHRGTDLEAGGLGAGS